MKWFQNKTQWLSFQQWKWITRISAWFGWAWLDSAWLDSLSLSPSLSSSSSSLVVPNYPFKKTSHMNDNMEKNIMGRDRMGRDWTGQDDECAPCPPDWSCSCCDSFYLAKENRLDWIKRLFPLWTATQLTNTANKHLDQHWLNNDNDSARSRVDGRQWWC